jgi:transposase InsO family protein
MTLKDSIHGLRLHVMRRAAELGNVSQACREAGISRSLFYNWRKRYVAYGPEGLHPRHTEARRGRPSAVPLPVERAVLAMALAWPTWGPARLSAQLARPEYGGCRLAPATLHRLLRRAGLGTRLQRLAILEHHSARAAGLLTERTRRRLWHAQYGRSQHVHATTPGELVCIDTFYIGKLKGVGKVWQYTACDAACSHAVARLSTDFSADAAARFLREVVQEYARAGWSVQRVLSDRGPEYRGTLDQTCRELGIKHTRTKPRHAWTNGFVERLQGTILSELWRVEFRRRFFTSVAAMQEVLDSYLHFYNWRRPHLGYRLQGRTPAEVFHHA